MFRFRKFVGRNGVAKIGACEVQCRFHPNGAVIRIERNSYDLREEGASVTIDLNNKPSMARLTEKGIEIPYGKGVFLFDKNYDVKFIDYSRKSRKVLRLAIFTLVLIASGLLVNGAISRSKRTSVRQGSF